MKIYYPVKPKLEYTARGESCFIKQDNIYYLRRPIEAKFYNGMTWENYGTKWRINRPSPTTPPASPVSQVPPVIFGLQGKPVLI